MTKGIRLGKYILHEKLGRGGFGTVYRTQGTIHDVERAVKILHPALTADPEVQRIEAQLAARLEHPHIIPVYDLGEAEGSVFLAMKYMPVGLLKDLLAREGKLLFARAVEITRQIADAQDYAHTLTRTGSSARLTGFGFAKALASSGSASLSASGAMLGTPAYMPSETQMGQATSPAADVYSLACVTYEMLTGKSLFGGDSPPPLVMKRHFDPLALPATLPEEVLLVITHVLEKTLAKEPGECYPGLDEFATALANLRALEAAHTNMPIPEEPHHEREAALAQKPAAKPVGAARQARQEGMKKTPAPVKQVAISYSQSNPSSPAKKKPVWKPWAIGLGGLLVVVSCIFAVLMGPALFATPAHMPTKADATTDGHLLRIITIEGTASSVDFVAFSPDDFTLASGGSDSTLKLWNIESSHLLQTLECQSDIQSVAYSPDGPTLALGSLDGTIQLWEIP